MLSFGDKIAIVACSDARRRSEQATIDKLMRTLEYMGLRPVMSRHIYGENALDGGSPEERAAALLEFYGDSGIKAIFDISGGDIANELLGCLDYEFIGANWKPFFGYSDLTVIINAIYAMSGRTSYLYQIRNIISECGIRQLEQFKNSMLGGKKDIYLFKYKFIRGESMRGVVVGGNVRCLLKLAGTPYMPDLEGKILFLESRSGPAPRIATFFYQLKQMNAFEKLSGVLLGTFTELDASEGEEAAAGLLIEAIGESGLPVAVTRDIGHGSDSKCLVIGAEYELTDRN